MNNSAVPKNQGFNFNSEQTHHNNNVQNNKPSMSYSQLISEFQSTIRKHGLLADSVYPNGTLYRCSTETYPYRTDGWYQLTDLGDGMIYGKYGDWVYDEFGVEWKSWEIAGLENSTTSIDREEMKRRMEEHKRNERIRSNEEQIEQGSRYFAEYSALPILTEHPYLARKKVGIHGLLKYDPSRGCIVVPLADETNTFLGIQRIYDEKLESGATKTLHGVISRADRKPFHISYGECDVVYITEGYATFASVIEATGKTTYLALNAGRLKDIGRIARKTYPDADIVFAADNDCENKDNIGVRKANEAASNVGGRVVFPEMNGKTCDFNDLHAKYGIDAVRVQLGADEQNEYGSCNFMDIMDIEYPDNPIFDGLLDEKQCMIISGDPNVGKSLLSILFAAHLGNPMLKSPQWATGNVDPAVNAVFGQFGVRTYGKTLFVQNENAGKSLQQRARLMMENNDLIHSALHARSLELMTQNDEPMADGLLTDPRFMSRLEMEIIKKNIRLLVVDPMSSYIEAEENDNNAMLQALNKGFRAIVRRHNISIIIIHHSNKSGGMRGASSIQGWVDTLLEFEEVGTDDDGTIIKMNYSKARSFAKDPNVLYVRKTKKLNFVESSKEEADAMISENEPPHRRGRQKTSECSVQDVINAMLSKGGAIRGKSELTRIVCNNASCSASKAKNAIAEAIDNGSIIEEQGEGLNKKNYKLLQGV